MKIRDYSLRRWAPGDEAAFTPRGDFEAERRAVDWRWDGGAPGPTWTILKHDTVLGVGGAVAAGGGAYDAWASLSPLRPREWWIAMTFAACVLQTLKREHGARIVGTWCRSEVPAARRCLEMLGFAAVGQVGDDRLPGARLLYMQWSG